MSAPSDWTRGLRHGLQALGTVAVLSLSAVAAAAPVTTVNLSAQRMTKALPDGTIVPMWGYCTDDDPAGRGLTGAHLLHANACTTAVTGATTRVANTAWAPGPTIVVPVGNQLSITLTNKLAPGVPTSLVILGQIGGNAGHPTRDSAPVDHPSQTMTTWPANAAATFTPPQQAARARAFGQEAAFGSTVTAVWNTNLIPGARAAKYLKPGTYLYETGSHPSLQVPMGLYGILIVTQAPAYEITGSGTATAKQTLARTGQAFPGAYANYGATSPLASLVNVPYDLDAALLFSEIDPVQNAAVDAAAAAGTSESIRWNDSRCTQSEKPAAAGLAQVACYPAAVNYAPTYFLVNGTPYNETSPADSSVVLPDLAASSSVTGNIMLRMANAGSRTHIPAVVGQPMTLVAEDGNVAPGNSKVQNEVIMPAGKTIDAMLRPLAGRPASALVRYDDAVYPFFDRGLALSSGNRTKGGIEGYIVVAPARTATSTAAALSASLNTAIGVSAKPAVVATAVPDFYTISPSATSLSNNVLANDIGVKRAVLQGQSLAPGATSTSAVLAYGTVTLDISGTFSYAVTKAPAGTSAPTIDSFTYCGNDSASVCALVSISWAPTGAPPTVASRVYDNSAASAYPSNVASVLRVPRGAGLLQGAVDPGGYPLTAAPVGTAPAWVTLNADGSFVATPCAAAPVTCTFQFSAVNSQGTASPAQTVSVVFPTPSGLPVRLVDAHYGSDLPNDYSWIIEEDRTFHNENPGVTPALVNGTPPRTLATSFFRSHMPVVAAGCTGPLSCGDAQTQGGTAKTAQIRSLPADVALDPAKYYFISIMPGDAANPVTAGFTGDPLASADCLTPSTGANDAKCGHTMGGAPISPLAGAAYPVTIVKVEPNPLRPAQLSVLIFEDGSPTNGDPDATEHGLGGFELRIFDVAGRTGDPIGQITYDAFNMPLSNALLGSPGCPNVYSQTASSTRRTSPNYAAKDMTGVIITCPNDPIDPANPSADYALQGQALIKNLMPGRFDVVADPGAARRGAGEQWYQVSTLEGTAAQDAFIKSGEPAFFQEFGPPGFHTFIGYINPDHIAKQNKIATHVPRSGVPATPGGDTEGPPITGPVALATTTVSGRITSLHMSRPVMETLWDSGSRAPLASTTCFVGLNQQGEVGLNIGFATCDADGNFTLTNIPVGSYMLVIWDRWLDQIISYKAVQVLAGKTPDANGNPVPAGAIAMGNIPVFSWFTRVETSVYMDQNNNGTRDGGEPGVAQVPVTIRFRDGSVSNIAPTDNDGNAVFNELFPLFNWYVVESDRTRFASTGVNVTVDGGGLPDCTRFNAATGQGTVGSANQNSTMPCARTGGLINSSYVWNDPISGKSFGAVPAGTAPATNRIDGGSVLYEGFQGFINQTQILDWGKRAFNVGENGGIQGMVVYASTRGFDDPSLEVQFKWEPGVPRVKINLYKKSVNADGTVALTLTNSTTTTSWDDYANGKKADGTPNMVCPGQDANDPFLTYTLGAAGQFDCYDGFHLWNQVQPAVYDGAYAFTTDAAGNPLSPGRYVVEMIPPAGYELVKEEDKNILIGDAWVAPAAQQFGALTNIFIMPDQAQVGAYYNPNNPNNATTTLGFQGAKQVFPACVGTSRTVPDFMSLFPSAGQVAPFAGAVKPLCDRKEVVLADQSAAKANFFVFSNTPVAAHFTGMMLDDAATEINAISPDFGEKYAMPHAPVSLRDMNGVEISRVYTDQWGTFNGMAPSTWQVNVPNPAGYSPNMLISCMNDPGPILDTRPGSTTLGKMITDPMFNPAFSNFCYTWPYMPGATVYLDTPVLPTAAFADGYSPADCSYPDATPSLRRVDGDGIGPWVAAADGTHTLTVTAMGDADVPNPVYQGPTATAAPFNQRTVKRHYGFGAQGTISIQGTPLTNVSWSDGVITATVPAGAVTGELNITNAAGVSTVDSVTVTIGGPAPVVVKPTFSSPTPTAAASASAGYPHPIQDAIDAAHPGDLIIVDEGTYPELVIMWKPVQLQGVGAASVVINAAKYPTQKLEDWRPRINKLFGIDVTTGNLSSKPQIDPLPTQLPITGGVVLLEPTILATEEGAGITVLAKDLPVTDCKASRSPDAGPSNYYAVTQTNQGVPSKVAVQPTGWNMGDSNFLCAKSRIDGLSITGSDAGGGIYANGWAHGLEVSNNRIYGNASSMHGGMRIGSPFEEETPQAAGYGYDIGVKIHHNAITNNGTVEATPGAGGANVTGSGAGVSICTGTDNYEVNYNFICGNYSNGGGGGIGAIGVNMNGVIAHNKIVFNQSAQQTSAVHGGGIDIEGDLTTNATLSNGTGNITIDSNLIVGNFAQSGHGGGIRLQQVNGQDVVANPHKPAKWYRATVTNNIITNNVAGWSGGGISLVDTLNAVIHENTIANNDSAAIVGPLFGTNGRGPTTSFAGPAGISTDMTSTALLAVLPTKATAAIPAAATKAFNSYSNPVLFNDIIWHNRSFFVDASGGVGASHVCSSNDTTNRTCVVLPAATSAGQCTGAPAYWDIGTVGDVSAAASNFTIADLRNSVLSPGGSVYGANAATGVSVADPGLVQPYCNGPRVNPGMIFEPGQPFLPAFSMVAGITLDEAGNFVDLKYGPLSLTDPLQNGAVAFGDYRVTTTGAAYNAGVGADPSVNVAASRLDYLGTTRPDAGRTPGVDIGAIQAPSPVGTAAAVTTLATTLQAAPAIARATLTATAVAPRVPPLVPQASLVAPAPASILSALHCGTAGQPACGTTTLQLSNSGKAALTITGIATNNRTGFTVTSACGPTLAPGGRCAITVTYQPLTTQAVTTTVVVSDNSGGVANSTQVAAISGTGR